MKKGRKSARIAKLEADVAELMSSVEENRRLNERLSDVLDVVTELLVPAAGRDDPRVEEALDKLEKSKKRVTRKR
jgi:hypothetical protein